MFGCALAKQVDNVGTIIGNEVCNWRAEQFAIIPKIQIYEILTLQFDSFYNPFNKCGNKFLTAYALIFNINVWITLFDMFLTYYIESAIYPITISTILFACIYTNRPNIYTKAVNK